MGEITSSYRRWLYASALLFLMIATEPLAAQTRSFDIEAGDANATLREFAKQARADVVMDRMDVQGVQTKEVSGLLEPRIALELMLQDTLLIFNEDQETGAFAVTRAPAAMLEPDAYSSAASSLDANQQLMQETEMNTSRNNWLKTLTAVLSIGLVGSGGQLAAQDNADDIFELSPFTVDESSDVGYLATNTLAGTRLNTELKDVGAAISVMTEEFFNDTGATDGATALSYALNIDVGGDQGNYAGGFTAGPTGSDQSEQRKTPQAGQRVRGLDAASLTRDYFLTDIPFDTYNTSRVTISRGPNSLLFGIGSPGGVINNSLKKANVGSNFNEISLRLGERSSHRETIDINRVILDGRLAIRIAGLNDKF
ncbi:MAG: TonB-dependent receptor plug domain-containing protein, partial [Verrucomicrobiae bacterium]|nr:TonB-dependent receptor plug domain-containing protein [Verrucomicrobiae bacterium]